MYQWLFFFLTSQAFFKDLKRQCLLYVYLLHVKNGFILFTFFSHVFPGPTMQFVTKEHATMGYDGNSKDSITSLFNSERESRDREWSERYTKV
jgi:hypothetical protein